MEMFLPIFLNVVCVPLLVFGMKIPSGIVRTISPSVSPGLHAGKVPPSSCDKTWTCLGLFQPVCGTDGRTYDNNCYLRIQNCRDPSTRFKHHGSCEDVTGGIRCKRTCIHIPMQPVCGSDNIIYKNQCKLKNARCSNPNLIQVDCPSTGGVKKRCAGVCPLDYDPKCGSNGVTYINKCHIDLNTCKDARITLDYDGQCESPDTTSCTPCDGNEEEENVCGSDGVTYMSICAFNYALCKQPCPETLYLKKSGRCECDESCLFDTYDPICGSDGETYDTTCDFRVAACNDPTLKFKKTGGCSDHRD